MKNAIIKRIISCLENKLSNNELRDYCISINNVSTTEEFFVLQKLETTRITETSEANVTVYKQLEDGILGQASFNVTHDITKNEIDKLIDKTLFSASFVKNKDYNLVSGEKKIKRVKKQSLFNPFDLLQDLGLAFINSSIDNNDYSIKFNSLELFYKDTNIHIINSQGVDYEKRVSEVMIEAIPSYTNKSTNFKTELYRMFKYKDIDDKLVEKATNDANEAISDCTLRAKANDNDFANKPDTIDVILRNKDILQLLKGFIEPYDYSSVYNKSNIHNVGDDVQTSPLSKLNISLCKASKEDFFDGEGILLEDKEIIKDGVLVSYYGSQRFASYLNVLPTGRLPLLKVSKGKKSIEEIKKKPYIEIIDLSGIQVDIYQGYVGGEVRLANYFDGSNCYPISGFSFSADLKEVMNNFEFSKDIISTISYSGPKYMKLNNVKIN